MHINDFITPKSNHKPTVSALIINVIVQDIYNIIRDHSEENKWQNLGTLLKASTTPYPTSSPSNALL